MHSKFKEMLAKKRDMKPSEKHAKMGVLKDLKHSLADSMGDKLDGMKKVSVMSNSPQGMATGLDQAQQMSSQDPSLMSQMSEGGIASDEENPSGSEPDEVDESPAEEDLEESSMGHEMSENMDLDEIKKRIEHLMSLQKHMESKG